MWTRSSRRTLVLVAALLIGFCLLYNLQLPCINPGHIINRNIEVSPQKYLLNKDGSKYFYDRESPLIFIGGMPRSGTTLLRVVLDAHPDIRCGEETRVVPRLLSLRHQWTKAPVEAKRLQEAGVYGEVLDYAVASFILEVIARHGEPAPRLCNKDPFTLRSAVYLHGLFPKAKYIFMIRDGRAVVHSIIMRKVTITGFDLTDFRQCMKKWNTAMQSMNAQCQQLGPKVCMPVHYEQLVLHPRKWIERILEFLDVPWNDSVMHHDQFIGKPGGISLSKLERSTDQVIKPINIEALSTWVGKIPEDVVKDMATIAPMLAVLGYDPRGNPPNYGNPDAFVVDNTKEIVQHRDEWQKREHDLQKVREELHKELQKKAKQQGLHATKEAGANDISDSKVVNSKKAEVS